MDTKARVAPQDAMERTWTYEDGLRDGAAAVHRVQAEVWKGWDRIPLALEAFFYACAVLAAGGVVRAVERGDWLVLAFAVAWGPFLVYGLPAIKRWRESRK